MVQSTEQEMRVKSKQGVAALKLVNGGVSRPVAVLLASFFISLKCLT